MRIPLLLLSLLSGAALVMAGPAPDVLASFRCASSRTAYLVPDPKQCDRYAICTPGGAKTIQLCEDGYGLDVTKGTCDLLAKVDCGQRSQLQEVLVLNPNCPRANGFFAVEGACGEYIDCRGGRDFLNVCPAGTVFDSGVATCVHPDQTSRVECDAARFHNFTCPEFDIGVNRLRFGDHDRLAHPTDCSKFFACLLNGRPRLSTCKAPTVFDPESGLCKRYTLVPSCKDFYNANEVEDSDALRVVTLDFFNKNKPQIVN